jgi:hypothetical protein
MTQPPISLDRHRGMAAQKATELRRLLVEVAADQEALRGRQMALEAQLIAAPATSWAEAAEKARYLLKLFAATPLAQDPRRRMLIASALKDFRRLMAADAAGRGAVGNNDRSSVHSLEADLAVANPKQRSVREKRKPKTEKPKSSAALPPLTRPHTADGLKSTPGKNER